MSKKKKIIIFGVLVLLIGLFVAGRSVEVKSESTNSESGYIKVAVEKGDIKDSISNSSVIESEKRQQIKIKKAGTIEAVYVEEGQVVEKGDILMMMESGTENTDLEIAKKNLEIEMKDLDDLKDDLDKTKVYAKANGVYTMNDMNLVEGSMVNANEKLGDIYKADTLEVAVLFNLAIKDKFKVGDKAEVVIPESFEVVKGTVSSVSESSTMLESGNFGYKVAVDIANRGALGDNITPQVTIETADGKYTSLEVISIGKKEGADVITEVKGKINAVHVDEGDNVKKGDLLFEIESDDIQKSIDKQEITIEQKLLEINNKAETLEDVAITAPISGTIIKLDGNQGDNVDSNDVVAIIADTDNLKVILDVDELDIFNIEIGQQASITTDIFKQKQFSGVVDNIAMEGVSSNGVSTFEVAVALNQEDAKELRLGINVDVEITQGERTDTLILPVEAVKKRGNKYMVLTDIPSGDSDKIDLKAMKDSMKVVEVGLVTDTTVEIVDGLSEGDEVYYSKKVSNNTGNNNKAMMMMGAPGGALGGGMRGGK